jgi:hypothetical protein
LNFLKKIKTILFSRPVGYISPSTNYNQGKESEFENRKKYDLQQIKDELKQSEN